MKFLITYTFIALFFIACIPKRAMESDLTASTRSLIENYLLQKSFIHDARDDSRIAAGEAFTTFIPFHYFEGAEPKNNWHDNWRMQARNQPHESMVAISLAMMGQCSKAESLLSTFFNRIANNGAIEYHAMRENQRFADSPGMVGAPFLAWTTWKVAEICGHNIAGRFVGPLEHNWSWWQNHGARRFSNGACSGLWHWDNVYEAIRDSNRQAGHPNLPSWFLADGSLIINEICPPDLNFFLLGNLRSIVALKKMAGGNADTLQIEADALAGKIRQTLWDEGRQFFFGRRNNGDLIPVKDIGGWMALFANGASPDQARKMVTRYLSCQTPKPDDFCTPIGIPSLAKGEPGYGSNEHWLGGVWPAYTLMSVVGLRNYGFNGEASRIASSFANVVNKGLQSNMPLPEWYDNQSGIRRDTLFCTDQVQAGNKEQQKSVNCNYITSALALPTARYAMIDTNTDSSVQPGSPCRSANYTTCLKKPFGSKTLVCSIAQKVVACDQCVDGKVHDPNVAVDSRGYYHDFATGCE